MNATDWLAKADGVGGDILGQELHDLHKTFGNDIMCPGDLGPLTKLTQGHLIHTGRTAFATLHLKYEITSTQSIRSATFYINKIMLI